MIPHLTLTACVASAVLAGWIGYKVGHSASAEEAEARHARELTAQKAAFDGAMKLVDDANLAANEEADRSDYLAAKTQKVRTQYVQLPPSVVPADCRLSPERVQLIAAATAAANQAAGHTSEPQPTVPTTARPSSPNPRRAGGIHD